MILFHRTEGLDFGFWSLDLDLGALGCGFESAANDDDATVLISKTTRDFENVGIAILEDDFITTL